MYAISVAAEMVSMAIQNLRVYERHGLVWPTRTAGGTRLYSNVDIARLHRIRELLAEGLNLAGIAHVVRLEEEVRVLRKQRGKPAGATTATHLDRPQRARSRGASLIRRRGSRPAGRRSGQRPLLSWYAVMFRGASRQALIHSRRAVPVVIPPSS